MENVSTVFVTGATGFIGTRLVQALVERGYRVRALSRRLEVSAPPGFGFTDGGPLAHPNVELWKGDITDRRSLETGIEGCSHVFHLAAYAKNWAPDPRTYFEMNVQGMRNVFDACRTHAVRRVVWTSTCVTLGPSRGRQPVTEDSPRTTDRYFTEYEETKAIAEREALEQAAAGLPVVIVNPTRVYGPGHLTEGNSVTRLIDEYDRGRAPILLNRGVNIGNYVLVDDVVAGHLRAMEKGRIGQRYLLGGPENVSLREFFRTVDHVSGRKHLQIPIFRPGALTFAWLQKKRAEWLGIYPTITPGWVRTFLADWAVDCDKAVRELGLSPTPLEGGLRTTYQWLLHVRKEH